MLEPRRLVVVAALLSVLEPRAAAQHESAGHACRFSPPVAVRDLPPATRMAGVGSSSLVITTRSADAQRFFNQGLNLLHAFWDTEAYRAFREAARLDPDSPMPRWGIYMSLAQNAYEMAAERAEALKAAVSLAGRASEHEQFYIRAIAAQADPAKGRAAYIAEMEALIDRFPADIEAQLLLANLLSTPAGSYAPDGRPRDGKLYGQAILRNLLKSHPRHAAVHHYWIHAVENGPRPEIALESAALLPSLAPGSGHMLHMPGHIYYRLGRYDEARAAFLKSKAFDERYMSASAMHPINTWNYVHNLDYLVATNAESGRLNDALALAGQLREIHTQVERSGAAGIGYITFGGHTAVARLHLRFGRWSDAVTAIDEALRTATVQSEALRGYYRGIAEYARGMAAAESGDAPAAQKHATALAGELERLATEKPLPGGDWYFRHAVRVLGVNGRELEGAVHAAKGEYDRALTVLSEAAEAERGLGYWEPPHYARPVQETLGGVLLKAGRPLEARAAYEAALRLRPNNGHALIGIARAESAAGRAAQARAAYDAFRRAWAGADPSLPQMKERLKQDRPQVY